MAPRFVGDDGCGVGEVEAAALLGDRNAEAVGDSFVGHHGFGKTRGFLAEQEGVTYVELAEGTQFYNAGIGVGPIVSTDAEIVIGGVVDV